MTRFAICLALSLTAAGLCALPAPADSRDSFEAADANRDGYVSFDEARGIFPTLLKHLYLQADENKDGKLDESEWSSLLGLTAAFPIGGL